MADEVSTGGKCNRIILGFLLVPFIGPFLGFTAVNIYLSIGKISSFSDIFVAPLFAAVHTVFGLYPIFLITVIICIPLQIILLKFNIVRLAVYLIVGGLIGLSVAYIINRHLGTSLLWLMGNYVPAGIVTTFIYWLIAFWRNPHFFPKEVKKEAGA